MKTCNFARSFITFVTKNRSNNARIQAEARCILLDQKTGISQEYYLVASCKGEDTYGKGRLFLMPSYDFCMIYSSTDFMIIRTHLNAGRDNATVGDNQGHFLDVHFYIKQTEGEVLESAESIVRATLDNALFNGRCQVADETGRYRAILEFPIKTMNVNDISNMYQVDTGPMILPDFLSDKERMVEKFRLAFVAFNLPDEAYFVIQEPTPINDGSMEKVSYYSNVIKMNTKNSIIKYGFPEER